MPSRGHPVSGAERGASPCISTEIPSSNPARDPGCQTSPAGPRLLRPGPRPRSWSLGAGSLRPRSRKGPGLASPLQRPSKVGGLRQLLSGVFSDVARVIDRSIDRSRTWRASRVFPARRHHPEGAGEASGAAWRSSVPERSCLRAARPGPGSRRRRHVGQGQPTGGCSLLVHGRSWGAVQSPPRECATPQQRPPGGRKCRLLGKAEGAWKGQ